MATILLIAQFLVAVAVGPGSLGRSFSMSAKGFSKSTITVTAAVQGLVSLSSVFVMGRLSTGLAGDGS